MASDQPSNGPSAATGPDPLVGTVLAERYRIERRIGVGGMGSVYLAEQLGLGRQVAVKVLKPEHHKDPQLVERFIREARATAAIRHQNVVEILDFGQIGGHAFFTMEALSGRELATLIGAGRRLSWPRTQAIGLQIARALVAAHATGVVHRDMKPSNVFLISRGQTADFVKVLDFGIAKINDGRQLTRAGMVFGTAAYMAPEQASGGELDGRADVYALGCILFEALTGRTPFTGTNFMEVVRDQMLATPPRVREVAAEVELPDGVEALIAQALAKLPDERFPDMASFERALAALPSLAVADVAPPVKSSSLTWVPAPAPKSAPVEHPDRLPTLAYLFTAFAHGTDGVLSADELRTLAERLRSWAPHESLERLGALLREIVGGYNQPHDKVAKLRACRASLAAALTPEQRARVLDDLREIAVADGHFDVAEQRFIDETRDAFGITREPIVRALAIMYLALAHAADGIVDANELRVVGELLQSWDPSASLTETGAVLRDAVAEYKRLADANARLNRARAAADVVARSLNSHARRQVLADLWRIAGADGHISPEEQRLIMEMVGRFNSAP